MPFSVVGNHTSVWGSFWNEGKWGFKCCYSFVKMSYCTGAAGRANFESTLVDAASAFERNTDHKREGSSSDHIDGDKSDRKKHKKKKKKKDKDKKNKHNEVDDFEAEVAKAMEKQRKEEETAELAAYLASENCNHLVGQLIPLAGGWAT